MALNQKKYEHKHETVLRDIRPLGQRISDGLQNPAYSAAIFVSASVSMYVNDWMLTFGDLIMVFMALYFVWLKSRPRSLPFKMPLGVKHPDPNNGRNGQPGKSEGIMYVGNAQKTGEEVWFTNSDIRTHILYLGTTGAGKTEGLKSLVSNAICWGSGFVYVDGKADTDLWSSLSSLVRRMGRDDDLLVLNYMTGNSDSAAPSNTMNPFSSGSASYLTNMLVSLMPDGGGDNAMWKERAVSLVGAMMPALTWKRDYQEIPMSVRTIRDYLSLNNVIKLARDDAVPPEIRAGLTGYLDTLPGFIHEAYDDEGKVKPPGPDTPQYNTETASQQHGYLAMQFTRSLQSLGDDYGYIFDTQGADVDMVDVVLNRRILVVLVPALEKSGDEVANLGKIVAASIKGMMGSALGSTVEGTSSTVIENKPTHSSTPFLTVFDEVGYYVAEGMAVMAAQARSLGFSLVFAGQDLPAMKKRVREEAQSITANCNLKLFGKLEDPTETKDFFEKTVGSAMVTEASGFQASGGGTSSYYDSKQASVQLRPRASYDGLRGFKEGQAVVTYGETVMDCNIFYSNPGFAKAMRVTRYVVLPPPDETLINNAASIRKLRDLMVNKNWTAKRADVAVETSDVIAALAQGAKKNKKPNVNPVDMGISSIVYVHALSDAIPESTVPIAPKKPTPVQETQAPAPEEKPTGAAEAEAPVAPKKAEPDVAKPAEEAKKPPPIFGAPKDAPKEQAKQEEDKSDEGKASEGGSTGGAKPSIFGGAKPAAEAAPAAPDPEKKQEPKAEAPQQTAASEAPSTTAKPAIFGGGAPKVDAPEAPQEKAAPVSAPPEEKPTVEKPAESVAAKPAIFGGAKPAAEVTPAATESEKTEEPKAEAPQQPAASDAPSTTAKPAIFGGGAPKVDAREAPQEKAAPVSAPPEEKPTVEKPAESAAAKPAIFGGAKPAAEVMPAATEPEKTEEPKAEAPQQPAASDAPSTTAKPAIFGGSAPKAEAPAAPSKPAVFGGAKPKEEEDSGKTDGSQSSQGEGKQEGPKKPAIFGQKPKSHETDTE